MGTSQTRRKQIVDLVNSMGSISVVELSLYFRVSKVTIRSDLDALEKEEQLIRMHGSAMSINYNKDQNTLRYAAELHFHEKQHHNRGIKEKLARRALKYIEDYDTILLDSGTTMFEIATQIARKQWTRLTVITSSLPVCDLLCNFKGIEVVLLGGHYRKKSRSFSGAATEQMLLALRFNKLFMGADGYHPQHGLTTLSENEASLNRLMVEMASQVYVVMDHSKFGRQSSNWICEFGRPNVVITDDRLKHEYINELQECQVKVDVAK
ncbi:DeoR/GlpR family DNA-binding transcription regulator [Psittacicella hinzii]|uniref:HTH deoR-type domain-containing protein n=1 Tax=Psittacicella hinzii TaxID=2028575 RepID=A0A3A1YG70_9GAMM|nr:DeoR/GlpR family DNA-binding transcription regulator [Psittacicella hinzii]RIY37142.1 hypothetical protein CKF58_05150 [Psittacicella hinzii]